MLAVLLKGLIKKRTVFRTLFEYALIQESPSQGRVVDLGGVKHPIPGYAKVLKVDMDNVKTINLSTEVGADIIADAAHTELADDSADEVWMFNLLEHIEHPEHVITEARRLLRPKGRIMAVIPFLLGIHGEPDDFVRYTKSKLQKVWRDNGFMDCHVYSLGYGPFIAGFAQVQLFLPRILAVPMSIVAWSCDALLFSLRPQWKDRWPLGYLIVARAD